MWVDAGQLRADKETRTMRMKLRHAGLIWLEQRRRCVCGEREVARGESRGRAGFGASDKAVAVSDAAAKLNSVGVAYMGSKVADAQKESKRPWRRMKLRAGEIESGNFVDGSAEIGCGARGFDGSDGEAAEGPYAWYNLAW